MDKHFTALNNRYLNVYGDIIEASRTHDPNEMLAYLASSIGIKNGMKILDAGCGTGNYIANCLVGNVRKIVGLDVNLAMLQKASQKLKLNGSADEKIKLVQHSLLEIQ